MILNCMIVDDDPAASALLSRHCKKTSGLNLVVAFENPELALSEFSNYEVDLIFLDMMMPQMIGIDFLNQLPALPMVIFTTSRTDFAYQAFKFEAVDYLKKPVLYYEFTRAVEKAFIKQKASLPQQPLVPVSEDSQSNIFIKENGRLIRLPITDVLYFENEGDYVRVQTTNQQYLIYGTLKNINSKLPDNHFFRVHRSFIVNLNKIVDIEENSLVIERKLIPIGKSYKANLLKALPTIC